MKIPNIIEFHPQYTEQTKHLFTMALQSLDLSEAPEAPDTQPLIPQVKYDDSDLDRIAETYSRRSRFWLALVDKEVVGMVAIAEADAATALLRRMFVAPAYHGAGVGKLLLETALEFAETQGFQTVELDTHVGMKRAHAFYEKHGFRQTADDGWQRHYRLPLTARVTHIPPSQDEW